MAMTPHAGAGGMDRLDGVALALLLGTSVAAGFLVPESPLRHLDDPAYRAALSMIPVLLAIGVLRALGRKGTRFEQALFALFLAAMPTIYIGSCLRLGGGPCLWVELGGLVVYAGLAVLGLLRSPWFLAAGIAGHGLLWDSWHYALTSYIPRWYAIGCLVVDLGFAAYAAAQVRHWQARSRP